MSSWGSPNGERTYGSQGQRYLMEEDPNLTSEEIRRIPQLAGWVVRKLRGNEDWEMPFDDLVWELREEHLRGPVIDEIMVHLIERRMAQYIQRQDGNYIQAL